jgi:dTDP-4-dehydrorhamnose reductase
MRILVIGASGLIGTALMKELGQLGETTGTFHSYPEAGLIPLDISDPQAVDAIIRQVSPQILCQAAALTHVDYCETHPDEARCINVDGTRHLAVAARRLGARYVYVSTDYVFDGTAGPYSEDDAPCPTSVYGHTKLAGEEIVRETVADHLIVRTTVVYGWEPQGKNFVTRLVRELGNGKTQRVPVDQIGSPTYARNLAEAVRELVQREKVGTYNIAGCQLVDRYHFALAVARVFGLRADLLTPVTTAELGQDAPRPLQAGLKVDKAKRELTTPLLGYEAGLQAMKKARLD